MGLNQLKLPWQKVRETPRSKAWEVDIGEEAKAMIRAERNEIRRVKQDLFDLIISSYASSKDRVDLISVVEGVTCGTELWVNGQRKGVFLKEKEELVFRILPK